MAILFYLTLSAALPVFALEPCAPVTRDVKRDEFTVRYIEFQPAKDSSKIVIVVPPTGGTNFMDRSYGANLCEKGIGAAIVDGWSNDDEFNYELEIHTRFYRRAQASIDLVVDQFKGKSIGLLGTSVGAIHGAIAFERNENIKSAFLIVGGGDIPAIIATSDQQVMLDAKKERFKRFGFKSIEEYRAALKKVIPFEPLELSFNRIGKKLGMIISTNDSTVPTANQFLLRNKLHPDFEFQSSWWHVGTILKTWLFDKQTVVDFFM